MELITLEDVVKQVSECQKCTLYHSRKKSVPGEGPAHAEIMLIGEGPGFHENEQGRPFVGPAGKFLGELLAAAGLQRNDVYITNVVKCRPPANRDPLPDELEACKTYLLRQIELIDPRVIVTLGRFSMAHFLSAVKISEIHGQARWVNERLIVAMYHPAAALHQPALKSSIEQDFRKLPQFVEMAKAASKPKKIEPPPPPATDAPKEQSVQLSLF